jgi:hypothetical protein
LTLPVRFQRWTFPVQLALRTAIARFMDPEQFVILRIFQEYVAHFWRLRWVRQALEWRLLASFCFIDCT